MTTAADKFNPFRQPLSMSDSPKYKLLVLSDSPTLQTGFARVIQNLLPWWRASGAFERIDVWAIGYEGWPHDLPYRLFPAQSYAYRQWFEDENLKRFLSFLDHGGYTHLFIIQDTFHVSRMAKSLGEICRERRIKSLLYYPVDAPIDPVWGKCVREVDVAVAYTNYGYEEMKKAPGLGNLKKIVLPHGTDTERYYRSHEDRTKGRGMFTDGQGRIVVGPRDFLIVNVSAHQKRKGLAQTLQTFKILRELLGDKYGELKLYMHMPVTNPDEQSDLRLIALQLDLRGCVLFAEGTFIGNASRLGEDHMRMIYNAADLVLTTTLGEGWGLPITEAMACGTPVAGPCHTAVKELFDIADVPFGDASIDLPRGIGFECSAEVVLPADNMRMRPVTDVQDAARMIADAIMADPESAFSLNSTSKRAFEWVTRPEFRWEYIAGQWMTLMEV